MSEFEKNQREVTDSVESTPVTLRELGYPGPAPVEVETVAERLSEKGVIFQRMSAEIYPGMPFTTPDDLADTGATQYSYRHINRLIKDGTIPAIKFNGRVLLTPESVDALLRLQEERLAQETEASNRRPGPRSLRTPRLKRNRT